MNKILSFILIIFFSNCKNSEPINYYPSVDSFQTRELVEVELDPELSFRQITNRIDSIYRIGSKPFFEIKNHGKIEKIVPFRNSDIGVPGINLVIISRDSVFSTKDHSIDKMPEVLEEFYERRKISPVYRPTRHFLEIDIDTSSTGEELQELLREVINTFNTIDQAHPDSLELKLTFSYLRQILPPPDLLETKE